MEKERARLRSLAADFGFDEELAQACLEWIINLYGNFLDLQPFLNSKIAVQFPLLICFAI